MANNEAKVGIPDGKIAAVCCGFSDIGAGKRCYKILAFDRNEIKTKMEKSLPLSFKCPKCGYVNCIMGLVDSPNGYGNINVKDHLECVAYTGPLNEDSVGLIKDGTKRLYVDINGHQWSSDEYRDINIKDPSLNILKRIRDDSTVKDVGIPDDRSLSVCCGYIDEVAKKQCHTPLTLDRKTITDKINKNEKPSFECPKCKSVNCVMGKTKQLGNIKAADYLECIAYTGPLSKDAVGMINDGTQILYVDINGRQWSRDGYKAQYGVDPSLHILKRIGFQEATDTIYKYIEDNWHK